MKNIKKILREEFSSITPKQSEKLRQTNISVKGKQKLNFKKMFLPICAILSCCCCVLCLVFLLPSQGDEVYALGSYISISFNPALSFTIDDDGNVESLVAENYDAEIVLSGLSLSGKNAYGNYQDVIYDVICQSEGLGYLDSVDTIYVEIFCFQEDEKTLNLITEKINEVIESATSGKAISISEMGKDDILEKAKEIDQNITEDIDVGSLHETLKNAQSYSEKLKNNIGENSDGLLEIYDLQILSCTISTVEDMQKIYQEIQEICEQENIRQSEILTCDNQRIKQLLDEYSRKLEWFGLELSSESFGYLISEYEPSADEKGKLSEIINDFREKGGLPADSFSKDEIMKSETISYYYALACDKHSIAQDSTASEILRAITELETSIRLDVLGI